ATRRPPSCTARGLRCATRPARCWPTGWGCWASAHRSGCDHRRAPSRGGGGVRAHPAGPLHAGFLAPPETAGPRPATAAELDALAPAVWPRHAVRGAAGSVEIAGVDEIGRAH